MDRLIAVHASIINNPENSNRCKASDNRMKGRCSLGSARRRRQAGPREPFALTACCRPARRVGPGTSASLRDVKWAGQALHSFRGPDWNSGHRRAVRPTHDNPTMSPAARQRGRWQRTQNRQGEECPSHWWIAPSRVRGDQTSPRQPTNHYDTRSESPAEFPYRCVKSSDRGLSPFSPSSALRLLTWSG